MDKTRFFSLSDTRSFEFTYPLKRTHVPVDLKIHPGKQETSLIHWAVGRRSSFLTKIHLCEGKENDRPK